MCKKKRLGRDVLGEESGDSGNGVEKGVDEVRGVTYKGTGKQIPNDIRKTINYEICRTKKFTEIINWWRGGSS